MKYLCFWLYLYSRLNYYEKFFPQKTHHNFFAFSALNVGNDIGLNELYIHIYQIHEIEHLDKLMGLSLLGD